jgi:glycosyltransferase involved in cell wall biosynthesis
MALILSSAAPVTRILLVASSPASFIELDRRLLDSRYEVQARYGKRPQRDVLALVRDVLRADVVLGWWAHWHTFLPFTLAWLLRTPTVLIVGGFDTANLPDIGYGNQRTGWRHAVRRLTSRWIMSRADVLATNSHYSMTELERNAGITGSRVIVVHHGVPDPFGAEPGEPERLAVTVGLVDTVNLERKGLRAFVRAAGAVPDARFVVVGRWVDAAADELRALAGENVSLAGFLEQAELEALLRRAGAYVQASRHEGFGVAVAEAMLAGAVPVVTGVGALPEVVGDAGIVVDAATPDALAAGVREALAAGPERRRAARERVLAEFTVEGRRTGLEELVKRARAARRSPGAVGA